MKVKVDSYSGTGSAHSITGLGFQPIMVLIKGGANIGVIRVSAMSGNNTKPVVGTTAFFSGGITSLDADGFSVGTDARVNASGTTYYYVAVGSDGSSDVASATYTGSGAAGNGVTGAGFAPNAVIAFANDADSLMYRSTPMANGQAWDGGELANTITSLDADGFTVGSRVTSPSVNVNTTTYYYVALKDAANLFYGSLGWTGDGANPRTLTGVGFAPDLGMSKRRNTSNVMVAKHNDESGQNNLYYDANAESTGVITALTSDGMTVTASAFVNQNTATYAGLFFKSTPQVTWAAAGSSAFGIVGGAQNYGAFSSPGSSAFAVSPTYTPPLGFGAAGGSTFAVVPTLSTSARFAARANSQFLLDPNSPGVSGSFAVRGESRFFVLPASTSPPALAPYGGLHNISVLVGDFGGTFLFEQSVNSPNALENLDFATAIPGGDESATIATRIRHATTLQLPAIGANILITDLAGPFWFGILDRVEMTYWNSGSSVGADVILHALGGSAWADDQVFKERTVFLATDTAYTMFTRARDRLVQGLSPTNDFLHASSLVTLGEDTKNFRGDPALAVWNAAAALGSTYADADPLIWQVRLPLTATYPLAVPILEVYGVPAAPSYTIDLTDGYSVRTQIERQQVRNHILLNYGTGTGDILHETEEENRVAVGFDAAGWADISYRPRDMWIDASTSAFRWGAQFAAARIVAANLRKYGRLKSAGETITIPYDARGEHPITVDPGPTTIPIWRARAGYRLNVSNQPTFANLSFSRETLITRTRFSLREAKVQLTTGVLGDSRQARRMTGVATLRQLLDLPPLSRPNRPEEWQRINLELGPMDAQEDPVFLQVEFPHILRVITVFAVALVEEQGSFQSLDVEVGVGRQGNWSDPPIYDVIATQTIAAPRTQIASGLNRNMEPGAFYIAYLRNPIPAGVRALVSIGVDRQKVIE